MRRRRRYGFTHVPTGETGVDRMVDLIDEAPPPIDELPDDEPLG